MPESGLRDHLDHLWGMVGVVFTDILQFTHCGEDGQGTCFKAIMDKDNYVSEWTTSPFRPFMGHGRRLPFSTVAVRFTHSGENGQGTCFKAIMEVIGSQTMPVSGLVTHLDHFGTWWAVADFKRRGTIYTLW